LILARIARSLSTAIPPAAKKTGPKLSAVSSTGMPAM
jgi:hypothetical protein